MKPVPLLSLALALATLFATTPAEARFGRANSDAKQSGERTKDDDDDDEDHRHNPPPARGHVHEATPVNPPAPRSHSQRHHHRNDSSHWDGCGHEVVTGVSVYSPGYIVWAPRAGFAPLYGEDAQRTNNDRLRVLFLGETALSSRSATLTGGMRIEGQRFGVSLDARALFLAPELGGYDPDILRLASGHVTYALLSGDSGRLRLELGASGVIADQLSTMGPSVGFSADLAVLFAFGVEGSMHLTPFPHQALDMRMGANLSFGMLSLHGGVRRLYLNDMGLVDGVAHEENLVGPYAALGLRF
jgi:hypothetical protein